MSQNRYCATLQIPLNQAAIWRTADFLHCLLSLPPMSFWPGQPSDKNPTRRDHHRGFFMPGGMVLSDIPRRRPIGPAAQFQELACRRPQHTWYVGAIAHWNSTARLNQAVTAPPRVRAERPTSGFFLSATGCCRFLTVTDNHQKARSRPLRLPPSPDAWGSLRVLKDTYSHHFAPRTRSSLTGDGSLRTTSAFPESPRVRRRRKSPRRDPGSTGPDDRRTSDARSSTTRAAAPLLASSALRLSFRRRMPFSSACQGHFRSNTGSRALYHLR